MSDMEPEENQEDMQEEQEIIEELGTEDEAPNTDAMREEQLDIAAAAIASKTLKLLNEGAIIAQITDVQQTEKKTVITFADTDPAKFMPFFTNRGGWIAMTVRPAHNTEKFKESAEEDIEKNQLPLPLTMDGPMPPKPDSLKPIICASCGVDIMASEFNIATCSACGQIVCSACLGDDGKTCVKCEVQESDDYSDENLPADVND